MYSATIRCLPSCQKTQKHKLSPPFKFPLLHYLLMADAAPIAVCILVSVNILAIEATPRPSSDN